MSVSSVSISNMLFPHDPVLSKMEDPNLKWGDLLLKDVSQCLSKKQAIQRKYPVIVRLQSSKTLGIQWNMQKLADWRAGHLAPLDWKLYETATAREMIAALKNSGWIVSAPADPSFICSITRDIGDGATAVEWTYEEPDCPVMICLNDIKLFFPVIWHKLDSNCKMYSVEMYHDKIRSMALIRGENSELLTNHLSGLLTKSLLRSPAWSVAQSMLAGEHSRLIL